MTLRFAHAMIQLGDLEAGIAFYQKALGLSLADRHDYEDASLVYLRAPGGGAEVELLSERPWTYAARPEKGRCHIALTTTDLEAEHARLEAEGLEPGPITPHHAKGRLQTRYFYLYDPEGNEIEILEAMGRYRQDTTS